MRDFNVIIERDSDGYYVASVPALKGCYTQAQSLDELQDNIKEVIELCLEDQETDGGYVPEEFIGIQRISI